MNEEKGNASERELARHKWHEHRNGAMGGVLGVAFVGAAVYFIQQSDTFGMGVLGLLKALVWPAMLIHKIFTTLKV